MAAKKPHSGHSKHLCAMIAGGSGYKSVRPLVKSPKHIWDLLASPKTLEELIEHQLIRYDAPEDQVKQDLINFLESLALRGLIIQV